MTLDDNYIMPFGKYKDVKLEDVPADYLLWLKDQDWIETKYPAVAEYVYAKEEELRAELTDQRIAEGRFR